MRQVDDHPPEQGRRSPPEQPGPGHSPSRGLWRIRLRCRRRRRWIGGRWSWRRIVVGLGYVSHAPENGADAANDRFKGTKISGRGVRYSTRCRKGLIGLERLSTPDLELGDDFVCRRISASVQIRPPVRVVEKQFGALMARRVIKEPTPIGDIDAAGVNVQMDTALYQTSVTADIHRPPHFARRTHPPERRCRHGERRSTYGG